MTMWIMTKNPASTSGLHVAWVDRVGEDNPGNMELQLMVSVKLCQVSSIPWKSHRVVHRGFLNLSKTQLNRGNCFPTCSIQFHGHLHIRR